MLIFAVILTALMLLAMIIDFSRFLIPNWLNAAALVLYPVLIFLSPSPPDWKIALLIAAGTFAVGFILFILKAFGGGDVKLLAVVMLYAGRPEALDLFFGIAVFGGLLSIALLLTRPIIRYAAGSLKHPPKIPRVLTVGEPVPYGIAIASAFLVLLWTGKIAGIPLHG